MFNSLFGSIATTTAQMRANQTMERMARDQMIMSQSLTMRDHSLIQTYLTHQKTMTDQKTLDLIQTITRPMRKTTIPTVKRTKTT